MVGDDTTLFAFFSLLSTFYVPFEKFDGEGQEFIVRQIGEVEGGGLPGIEYSNITLPRDKTGDHLETAKYSGH